MYFKSTFFPLIVFILFSINISAQGVINDLKSKGQANQPSSLNVGCGSFDLMQQNDKEAPGYMDLSDDLIKNISKVIAVQSFNRSSSDVYTVPVVFHIVHNNA